jgi:hypothetical protein
MAQRAVDEKQIINTFIESPYIQGIKSFYSEETDPLAYIINEFSDCLSIEKKKCPYYPYFNIHYSDIRFSVNNGRVEGNGLLGFTILVIKRMKFLVNARDLNIFNKIMNEIIIYPRLFFDITIWKRYRK